MPNQILPSGLAFLAVLCILSLPARAAAAPKTDWDRCLTFDPATGQPVIDPICFFEVLVERYRRLSEYEDFARVTHVTRRSGQEPQTVETRIGCEVAGGELRVETPASQIRRRLGLRVPHHRTSPITETELQYKLWLAPHMALKFAEHADDDFRPGVEEGFTATEAEEVTIDERPMVHLELKSGDGRSADCEARLDFYVNPESLLVERVEGQHRLPDGANFETTLEITPLYVQEAPWDEPTESAPVAAEAPVAVEAPAAAPAVETTPAPEEESPRVPGVSTPPMPAGQPQEFVGRE